MLKLTIVKALIDAFTLSISIISGVSERILFTEILINSETIWL